MTSQKQTDANRRNALRSTGPRTEEGKRASRQNAIRHGLTAETVIIGIEDAAEYREFESEIVDEYDPKSVVERELTRRLASLLWRLRRANLIEAGLLSLNFESTPDRDEPRSLPQRVQIAMSSAVIRRLRLTTSPNQDNPLENQNQAIQPVGDGGPECSAKGRRDKQ